MSHRRSYRVALTKNIFQHRKFGEDLHREFNRLKIDEQDYMVSEIRSMFGHTFLIEAYLTYDQAEMICWWLYQHGV